MVRATYYMIGAILTVLTLGLWMSGYGPGGNSCRVPVAPTLSTSRLGRQVPPPEVGSISEQVVKPSVTEKVIQDTLPADAEKVGQVNLPTAIETVPSAIIFFVVDNYEVSQDARNLLSDVIRYLKTHKNAKAIVSGFHDPTGNVNYNKELSKNRALAVEQALLQGGIASDRVSLERPVPSTERGNKADVRRVEVSIH